MLNKNKKFLLMLTSLFLFMYFGMFANSVLAGTPHSLYDRVWRLINTKYVDVNQNGQDWQRWRHKYDRFIKTDDDVYVAIESMLASLNDPYTKFLDPDEFKEEGRSIKGTLYGIGIQIGIREDKLTVIAPIEDTPAYRAGLRANDIITEIDGKSTKGISVKEAADQIRGQKGTKVELTIKSGDEYKKVAIIRDKINIKSVSIKSPKYAKLKNNIGYIRLNSFISSNASKEMTDAIRKMNRKLGIILDIRSNPGGLLSNAIKISNMFLHNGVIVSTVDRDGYKETQRSYNSVLTDKPLVVLIDGGSASASEILSGALKDNGRAILVGTKTFGKGLVQEINPLPGGSGINITTQKYLTPNGTDINKVGIVPDIEVKTTKEDVKKKRDVQLIKAQEVLIKLIAENNSSKIPIKAVNPIKVIIH